MDANGNAESAAAVPGWYGKLPCLGDFASRRLPSEFIQTWDAWLQRSLAASRRSLGERWLDVFLTSPMWRFAVAPGVCGDDAYAGLLLPSVDKVGRYFPLTFALPLAREEVNLPRLFALQPWYAALEQIGLAALTVDCTPEKLELALAESPLPLAPLATDRDYPEGDGLFERSGAPRAVRLPRVEALPAAFEARVHALVRAHTSGMSWWWSVSADDGATECHACEGLPPDDYYSVLIGGTGTPEILPLDPLQALDAASR